ncbi:MULTISPECIES: hypothetical protein [Nitratiruptor]|uniref:Uncharacterized protein n=1 Tax=Nitratiruptor tergarcus DSM 16512 TaxID=1069081 RepID=A0A1W1WQJ7_9BACT|nr:MULTISPECIES: hypothetical protein [Nitratiruptor]BCD63039.1 hypothetical protein NitYY0813_C1927 [Nitratiruptor sp. YY08-13]BCD66974.1 hypothetical protein NitYY0826_C1929 [Nitratiruptor sp. YY08-26]SMC08557.1 hypothetical protein SAMN05660197_0312 [Nitratiruptor tergarcus DSM 16512]
MAHLERYMFYYMDTINEKNFKEAIELAQSIIEECEDESTPIIEGFLSAAKSLQALKMGEFDDVEELWNSYEEAKRFLTPSNRHYAILLETCMILENTKEEIERII